MSAARARAIEEAGYSIARQLNGPLTARFSQEEGERDYLQRLVKNALL